MRTLLFICFFVSSFTVKSQCDNWPNNFGGAAAPSAGNTNNFATNSWMGEYSIMSGTVIGTQYTFTISYGGCVTLRTTAGALIAFGASPFVWTATVAGNIEVHWNTNCATCGTNSINATTSVTNNSPPPTPADYTHPTTGIQNEFVGACLVADCGPFTYADNGNTSGDYANNINNIYRVFCPSIAGNCMQVTFNSFNTENGFDWLTVGNGPTQNSTVFTTPPANALGRIMGTPAVPFSYTSTDASGCLTFRFRSDASQTRAGWNATLQCVPCAGGPNGTDNSDCVNMTPLCSAAPVSTNSTGPGIIAEGCNGATCPAGGENHSNWYTFTAQTSGTLNVVVTPVNPADDYDIAIYGPNVTCGALGPALRCTDSGTPGTTGASPPGATPTQDVTGNPPFVSPLNVIAGQSYILVVDKWSPALASGYTLSFGGTASLDCTVLPIELTDFNAVYQPDLDLVDVYWTTASEYNSDYFNVEKSVDGVNYEVISRVEAVKNSTTETNYITIDEHPNLGVNYYRLNQFDADGSSKYSEVRAVNILDNEYDMLSVFPNPTTGITEVIFNAYSKGEAQLNVTSYNGSTIVNTPIEAKKGGNRFDLDLSGQARGMYIITITTKDKVYKTKVVKE